MQDVRIYYLIVSYTVFEVVIMVKQFNKAKISITIDYEVYEVIAKEAEKDDRSVSSMINIILRDYVKDKEGS